MWNNIFYYRLETNRQELCELEEKQVDRLRMLKESDKLLGEQQTELSQLRLLVTMNFN